jgi:hypothetical protein
MPGAGARSRWLGPALLSALFAGLTAWSWEKWADVHIDFGNELYLAWRLREGDALYRDLAYRHGPLSPHLNALAFALFGVSIRALALANLAVLAALTALAYRLFRPELGRLAATAAASVLLGVFGFSQYLPIANYNFVTPYQHHQSHGLLLACAMIACWGAAWREPRARRSAAWACGAGLCLGGVFLGKAELFAPAAVAAGLGCAVTAACAGERRRALFAAFGAGALLPPLAALAALAARMPAALAAQGVLGNWTQLAGALRDPFYLRGAGLDDPLGQLARSAGAALRLALFAAGALLADRWLPAGRARAAWAAAGGLALFAWAVRPGAVAWLELARGLPFAAAALCGLLLARLWARRHEPAALARAAPLALFAVLALGLLAKLGLDARIEHYGFALAMPATLLLVAGLLELGPRALGPGRGGVARALAGAAVAAGVVSCLALSQEFYRRKELALGEGADRILAASPWTSPRPRILAQALARLRALAAPGATLVVLPEGAILNYWLRLESPLRHWLFLPTEIAAFGEQAMLADLRAHPPDFVALVHRRAEEFGRGPFGADPRNGAALLAWVERHYRRVARLGEEPFGEGFGVVLLERAAPGAPRAARAALPGERGSLVE